MQEALTNVVKHARAESVAVDTEVADRDTLIIEMRDDGVGFDTSATSAEFDVAGCGMRDAGCGMRDAGCGMRDAGCGMRERTYLAGGSLTLTSSPAGTTVRMELPGGDGSPLMTRR